MFARRGLLSKLARFDIEARLSIYSAERCFINFRNHTSQFSPEAAEKVSGLMRRE